MKKFLTILFVPILIIIGIGYLLPEFKEMPCGAQIGTLGNSGNAKNTPPHVHYGIFTPIPYVWKFFIPIGEGNQPVRYNWMKMFWLDPADHLPTE